MYALEVDFELDVTMATLHLLGGDAQLCAWCKGSGHFPGGEPEVRARQKLFLSQHVNYQNAVLEKAREAAEEVRKAGG